MRNIIHFCVAKLLFSVVFVILHSSYAYSSVEKSTYGYRINISEVKLLTETYETLSITLNATNTGRADLHLGDENITPEMVIFIFDEEFKRSELREYKNDIQSQLLQQKIKLRKGKIRKEIQFYIPKSKDLAEKVTFQTYEPNIFNKPNISLKKNSKSTKKDKQEDVATADMKKSKTPSSAKKESKNKKKDTKVASVPSKPKKSSTSNKKKDTKIVSTPSNSTTATASNSKPSASAPSNNSNNSYTSKPVVKTQKENVQAAKASSMETATASTDSSFEKEVKKERSKVEKIKKEKTKEASSDKKNKPIEGTGFSTAAGINASKNSYKDKEKCPDMFLEKITVISQSSKWLELEYTIVNKGLGPANLYGESDGDNDNLALKAYLASSERLSRGSLPLGGDVVKKNKELKKGILDVNQSYTGTMKLDIRKMTRFTPYVILSLNPFNTINECDKTNNKNHILIEKK